MAGNYYFFLVGRNDNLLYECDFLKQVGGEKKNDSLYFYQFIAHASLDLIDEKLTKQPTFFSQVDRFNEWSVSAFVSPASLKFVVLHDVKNDDSIKGFCQDVYETYVKFLLNPFYNYNSSIKSDAFDRKVKAFGKRYFGF